MLGFLAGLTLLASTTSAEPPSSPSLSDIGLEVGIYQDEVKPSPQVTVAPHSEGWKAELALYPELEALAKCESGINESAVNEMDTDGYKAYGLFQYKTFTFEAFQKEMGVSGLDIMSGADQLKVTLWAFQNNKQSHWGICL